MNYNIFLVIWDELQSNLLHGYCCCMQHGLVVSYTYQWLPKQLPQFHIFLRINNCSGMWRRHTLNFTMVCVRRNSYYGMLCRGEMTLLRYVCGWVMRYVCGGVMTPLWYIYLRSYYIIQSVQLPAITEHQKRTKYLVSGANYTRQISIIIYRSASR